MTKYIKVGDVSHSLSWQDLFVSLQPQMCHEPIEVSTLQPQPTKSDTKLIEVQLECTSVNVGAIKNKEYFHES